MRALVCVALPATAMGTYASTVFPVRAAAGAVFKFSAAIAPRSPGVGWALTHSAGRIEPP